MFPGLLTSYLRKEVEETPKLFDALRPLLSRLLYHPSLLTIAKEKELQIARWKNVPPEEILCRCLARSIKPIHPSPPSSSSAFAASSAHARETMPSETESPSVSSAPSLFSSPSSRSLPPSGEGDKGGVQATVAHLLQLQFALEQNLVLEAPLSLWDSPSSSPSPSPSPSPSSSLSAPNSRDLSVQKKHILLLRNELLFERFLRQEYLNHLATLRKKGMESTGQREYLESLYSKLKEQNDVNNGLQTRHTGYCEAMDARERELVRFNAGLVDEIGRYKEQNRDLHLTIHRLEAELASARDEIRSHASSMARHTNDLLLRDLQLSDLKERIGQQEEEREKMMRMEREMCGWGGQSIFPLSTQSAEAHELSAQLMEKEERIRCLLQEKAARDVERKALVTTDEENRAEVARLEKEMRTLRDTVDQQRAFMRSKSEESHEMLMSMEAKVEMTERENLSLKKEVFRLNLEIEQLRAAAQAKPS